MTTEPGPGPDRTGSYARRGTALTARGSCRRPPIPTPNAVRAAFKRLDRSECIDEAISYLAEARAK